MLRASDLDRERVAERLRHAAGEGRILAEELEERLGAAFAARTYGQLDALVSDLPVPRRRERPVWFQASFVLVLALATLGVMAMAALVLLGAAAGWLAWAVVMWALWGRRRRAFPR